MKILALLWTVCLVRLCSAGFWCCGGSKTHDDEVTVRTVQGGSNKVSTENLRAVPPQQPVESLPQPTEPKEVPQDGINLDLAKPDETTSRLAPRNGLVLSPHGAFSITSVMDGNQVLWEAKEDNEKYVTINLYSKGVHPCYLVSK
ncbi:signal peptide containing protein [Theileria equi strain WA]|uniref:Signal peptide containing protein n=1 Tax=Theileria equi strain WA TaxID=1537102 RepID=L1LEW4_THEEQ|nr:signal peptide containing protein [Theileria equi strain WA]EKX73814.1 signal peptide containing protein [Theileria equi strain WA]|eukprot:XP_004833266.1 signal peptide containing protein [Theileria equi strain WA]